MRATPRACATTAAAHRRHETGKRGDLLSDGVAEPVGVAGCFSMRASISLAAGALGRTASAVPLLLAA